MNPADSPPPSDTAFSATWPLRLMALVLLALGVFPMAEFLHLANPQQWWPKALFGWLVWMPLVPGFSLLLAWRWPGRCARFVEWCTARVLAPTSRRFAFAVGTTTCVLAIVIGWFMFAGQGSTIDEMSQLWQARLLLGGRLSAHPELHEEFFNTAQTVSLGGRWFPHFPIGGPVLQALGLLLHVPWLINPLLGGLAAIAVYRFAAATGPELEARVIALLFVASPYVLTISGSRFDHAGTLAAIWLALAALPRWYAAETDADAHRGAAIVGAGLGLATMIRPYDGAVACVIVGGFQLLTAGRSARRWRSLATQGAVASIPVLVLLSVNRALTGHALAFAYDVVNGEEHRPGFHLSPLGFEHTPRIGILRISTYLMRINAMMLGWPVPVVVLAVLVLATQPRATRWDRLAVALLGATLAAYALYWGDGSFHGPRFLYIVVPVFLIFIARFPTALRASVRHPTARLAALLLIPLWVAAAWLSPEGRLAPYSAWAITVGAWEPAPSSRALIDTVVGRHLSNAVVFVPDGWSARLAARLRTLRVAPFPARRLAARRDLCRLQHLLDAAERTAAPIDVQAAYVLGAASQPDDSVGSAVPPECRWDAEHASSEGVDYSWMLARNALDSAGRLAGDVVFARDFGNRNELLRDRFGDRSWYVADVTSREDSVIVRLRPYAPPARLATQRSR